MPTTSNIAYCQSACRVQRNASAGGALACGRKRDLVGRSTGAEMDTPSLRPLRDVVGPYSLVHRSSRHETPEESVIAGLGASPGQWPQSLALGYEDQIAVMRTEIEGYPLAPDGNYDALIDVRRKAMIKDLSPARP